MAKSRIITVENIPIIIWKADIDSYIYMTDMVAEKSDDSRVADVIKN